jgi:16S rRNA processing protein RimM
MSLKSSKTEGRCDLPQTVTVGRVLRPHGLRGEVAVEVLSDVPGRLDPGNSLLLVREGEPPVPVVVAARGTEPPARPGPVTGRRTLARLRFAGVDDRDGAESLRGAWLEVERSQVPPAPAGEYYHYELVGCRCVVAGVELGAVVEVVEDGGGLLLIVSDGDRKVPVPFATRFLLAIDVASGRIELDLPPGLIEACASRS